MLDKNNKIIQIGDIVKIEKSPIKSDNATYVVVQDGTSKLYSGSDLTLYKAAKHKEGYSLSRSSYNICFYPLCNFSNKYKYSREEMNAATIEILMKCNEKAFDIVKSDNQYENEETENTYFSAVIKHNEKTIEDVSYSCSQSEKLVAFFSNISLKDGETIEIVKQDNTWGHYYKNIPYELKREGQEEIKENVEKTEIIENPDSKTVKDNYTYDIAEDIDTRDDSAIWVVKVKEKLSREEYKQVNDSMGDIGSYYSRFKHGFIFKSDPTELLNSDLSSKPDPEEQTKEEAQPEEQKEQPKPTIEYDIIKDKSPVDSKIIYLVKVKNELSKTDFAELKRNLAKIQGFYSGLKDSFIFKYDPTEKLIV